MSTPTPPDALAGPVTARWAPQPNRLTQHLGSHAPGPHTSVQLLVLAPTAGVLLVDVLSRGWDLPGGHLEAGEDAVAAAVRELTEEAGLTVPATAFEVAGYAHLHVAGPRPQGYQYPYPDSYQPLFVVRLDRDPHPGELRTRVPEEIGTVTFVAADELADRCPGRTWLPLVTAVLADLG